MSYRINVARHGRYLFHVNVESGAGASALVKEIVHKFQDAHTNVTATRETTTSTEVDVDALTQRDAADAAYRAAFKVWNRAGRPDAGTEADALESASAAHIEVQRALGY